MRDNPVSAAAEKLRPGMISALQSDHAAIHSAMAPRFARHCRREPYAGVFALFMSGLSAPIGIRRQPRWRRVMPTKSESLKKRMIRRHALLQIVPLADSTIYEMEQRGEFLVALHSPGAAWCGIWPRSKPGWPSAARRSKIGPATHPAARSCAPLSAARDASRVGSLAAWPHGGAA